MPYRGFIRAILFITGIAGVLILTSCSGEKVDLSHLEDQPSTANGVNLLPQGDFEGSLNGLGFEVNTGGSYTTDAAAAYNSAAGLRLNRSLVSYSMQIQTGKRYKVTLWARLKPDAVATQLPVFQVIISERTGNTIRGNGTQSRTLDTMEWKKYEIIVDHTATPPWVPYMIVYVNAWESNVVPVECDDLRIEEI